MTTLSNNIMTRLGSWLLWSAVFVATLAVGPKAHAQYDVTEPAACARTITAKVVLIENPTVFNRLGAQNPNWFTFALRRDAVYWDRLTPNDPHNGKSVDEAIADKGIPGVLGKIELRPDKRPRPLVLRAAEGDCLNVEFQNLLDPIANNQNPIQDNLDNNDQVAGRCAGINTTGTELRMVSNETGDPIGNDGSLVGQNHATDPNLGLDKNCKDDKRSGGMVGPGGEITYHLYTPHEGAYIINSYGALLGSEASSGNIALGMFGALNVQPKGADFYRSQVTEEEMRLATTGHVEPDPLCVATEDMRCDPGGQPIIDYEAKYPSGEPWSSEGKAGLPILNMLHSHDGIVELVHSDINAIIVGTGPNGTFPASTYPLESVGKNNPQYPNRLEPFREFTSQYHDEQTNSQVYPRWYNDPVLGFTLAGVKDAFMINYGSGGIGSEIISNRLHTGPMHDCTDCAYEEFFLSSSTVGDPALLVNRPANSGIEQCDPTAIAGPSCWRDPVNLANGPVAYPVTDETTGDILLFDLKTGTQTGSWSELGGKIGTGDPKMVPADNYALYQEDPYNVHHAYIGDQTKVRNTHAGSFEQHIFHLHNQQWQFNPSDDNANYLDAQEIMPGSGHTYELINGGAGNRNKTAGDAIYHCHFYPHFAQGMWYHIRIKDAFETGTQLAVSTPLELDEDGKATAGDINGDGYHDIPFALRSGKPAPGSRALPDGELPDGVPIPAIVPLPGKAMPPMPAKVQVAAVDRGSHSLLGGRKGPDGIPDSSQAFVDYVDAAGPDLHLGDDPETDFDESLDDVSPGYPFWLAGNECGVGGKATDADGNLLPLDQRVCPQGIVGQRMPTPPLDMLSQEGAAALNLQSGPNGMWKDVSPAQAGGWDGGLPRHSLLGYVSGGLSKDTQNRLDFQKIIELAAPVYYPEIGTELEQLAMRTHAVRERQSAANRLAGGIVRNDTFTMNGAPPVPGGPFQDPCVDDAGNRLLSGVVGEWFDGDGDPNSLNTRGGSEYHSQNPRTYRIANIQIDAVFNKVGYHYPQERIIALWGDVEATINKQRPPEPLVMRFNTFDCGKLLHSNLVPHEYEIDDFQVRTPTDIIGQHIHLPKWDLTTNDGAANGWNYEDGALAPGIVVERILAINNFNKYAKACQANSDDCIVPAGTLPGQLGDIDMTGLAPVPTIDTGDPGSSRDFKTNGTTDLVAADHPYFKPQAGNPQANAGKYRGARTVIQRILVDPVVNVAGVDRGLGLTFSHDHYGPSTFQQIGLYSTILAEPAGSTWVHNETGLPLYDGRKVAGSECLVNCTDGGPTSWQAAILPPASAKNGSTVQSEDIKDHREFYFEMSDFQHAYEPGVYIGADADGIPKHYDIIQPDPFDVTTAVVPELQNTWRQAVNPPMKLKSVPFPDIVTAENLCPGPAAKMVPDPDDPDKQIVATETRPDPATCDANGQNCDDFRDMSACTDTEPPIDRTSCPVIEFAIAADPVFGELHATNVSPLAPRPCVEAINISHSSMWVVNYRNEPIGLRVFDPDKKGPDNQNGSQADGMPGDLALAFQSRSDREIPQLNTALGDTPYPTPDYCSGTGDGINCDRRRGDPFTPIMRAYEYDEVKIKVQVGATEEQHQTSFHGLKWLSNGSGFGRSPNSGWRSFQSHGISEQFSLQMPIIPDRNQRGNSVDYLYAQDATRDGIWSGTWGILRSYGNRQSDLFELPESSVSGDIVLVDENDFMGVCPKYASDLNGNVMTDDLMKGKDKRVPTPLKEFMVFAVKANDVLPNVIDIGGRIKIPSLDEKNDLFLNHPDQTTFGEETVGGPLDPTGGTLVYNRRGTLVPTVTSEGESLRGGKGPLNDPTALMYVRAEDLTDRFIDGVSPDVEGDLDASGNPIGDGKDDRCYVVKYNKKGEITDRNFAPWTVGCPVKLRDDAPVEPMVIRANAGDCIDINLRNKLVDQAIQKDYAEGTDPRIFACDSVDGSGNCVAKGLPIFDDVLALKQTNSGKMLVNGDLETVASSEAELVNVEFDTIPDLAGWQDLFWIVNRHAMDGDGNFILPDNRRAGGQQMHFFNNNLIRPSALAGLHAQLVEYDGSKDDGVVVGNNPQSIVARPGSQQTYRYYAGHIEAQFIGEKTKGQKTVREFRRTATPIEFGGTNLLSADRIKQPQKGMYGALVIEPMDACHSDAPASCEKLGVPTPELELVADNQGMGTATRQTRAQQTIVAPDGKAGSGGTYDEAVSVAFRIANMRWQDGTAIPNIHQGELGREGTEDSGHAGFNYAAEPSWFRFKLPPDVPFGADGVTNSFGDIQNVHAFYANGLTTAEDNHVPFIEGVSALGDPATPVFRQTAGQAGRMHLLNGASADRDATFVLHGHVWQRAPNVCPQQSAYGLAGLCEYWKIPAAYDGDGNLVTGTGRESGPSIGSLALGLNPIGKYLGGEEGMGHAFSHWPILYKTGGSFGVAGDYLFRDYAPSGARNGMFGILRAEGTNDAGGN